MFFLLRKFFFISFLLAVGIFISTLKIGDKTVSDHFTKIQENQKVRTIVGRTNTIVEEKTKNWQKDAPRLFDQTRKKVATWLYPDVANSEPNQTQSKQLR